VKEATETCFGENFFVFFWKVSFQVLYTAYLPTILRL